MSRTITGAALRRRTAAMSPRQLAALRGNTFGVLAMLIVQFAVGMVVNLYATIPARDKGSGIVGAIGRALTNGPASLASHAGLGLLIVLVGVALVVRSIVARHTASILLSVVGLAAIVSAALNGARFVADGGPANASLAMALSTAVAMLCYALGLFLLGFSRPSSE
jgi:asparagine N-glycosylation enzyme membrane subunit Stt3